MPAKAPLVPKIPLYVVKGLLALSALLSGIATFTAAEPVTETFARLDLPARLMLWMGAAKLAGAVALWVPNAPALREWTYAGFAFAMTGAIYLHFSGGDSLAQSGGPIGLLALTLAAYAFERRQLANANANAADAGDVTDVR